MRPMVDLGFLLFTFFIFTATHSQPRSTRLIKPAEGESISILASRAMTVQLGKEKVFVYTGTWEEAIANNAFAAASYSLQNGFGNLIRQTQNTLATKDDLIVLLKPLPSASYQNIITALDEMLINDVKKYAITEATQQKCRRQCNAKWLSTTVLTNTKQENAGIRTCTRLQNKECLCKRTCRNFVDLSLNENFLYEHSCR